MDRFRFYVVDRFHGDAAAMRRRIDARLSDRRDPFDKSRFEWEAWHVPAQFSQLRTPARPFFGDALSASFEAALRRSLARAFGPVEVASPPWLSVLRDRDFQSLHRDSPNGDFAFSFGVGRESRFRGGDTLIAKDELLDYFGRRAHEGGAAGDPMFDEVPSRFNRLVVFDARLPHAVREVEGPREAKDGRIAVQGWIRARGISASGVGESEAKSAIARAVTKARLGDVDGLVGFAIAEGKARVVAHTLVAVSPRGNVARALASALAALRGVRLPKGAKVSASLRVGEGRASPAW